MRSLLTRDLRVLTEPDKTGTRDGIYTVRSLYLDSPDMSCFHEKAAGETCRHKLRIRGYFDGDVPGRKVKFEIKRRDGVRISKSYATVGLDRYAELLRALHDRRIPDFDLTSEDPNIVAFFARATARAMRPVMNVQFRRQAFVGRSDPSVRITFDDRLVARPARDLLDPLPIGPSILRPDTAILEIKVTRALPYWIKMLVNKYGLSVCSISKYCSAAHNGPFGLEGLMQ